MLRGQGRVVDCRRGRPGAPGRVSAGTGVLPGGHRCAPLRAQEKRTPNSQGGEDVQISFIRSVVSNDMGTYGSRINRAMRSQGTRMPVMRGGG